MKYVVSGRLNYSAQYSGVSGGQRTVDTFIDQVVFGMPVTAFDLWQKTHLLETSRRRNGECGIDIIVVSATSRGDWGGSQIRNKFIADEAAQLLVDLAK